MKNLRLITTVKLVLYCIFLVLNIVEFGYYFHEYVVYGGKLIITRKVRTIDSVLEWELLFHSILNSVSFLVMVFQMLIYNAFVKKYTAGKPVHVLWVLAAFIPGVYYVWCFILWRKLNRAIFSHFGKDPQASDRKIFLMWGILLVAVLATVFSSFLEHYLVRVGPMGSFRYARLSNLIHSAYLLVFSLIGLSYFMEFRRKITGRNVEVEISENQLLDE